MGCVRVERTQYRWGGKTTIMEDLSQKQQRQEWPWERFGGGATEVVHLLAVITIQASTSVRGWMPSSQSSQPRKEVSSTQGLDSKAGYHVGFGTFFLRGGGVLGFDPFFSQYAKPSASDRKKLTKICFLFVLQWSSAICARVYVQCCVCKTDANKAAGNIAQIHRCIL